MRKRLGREAARADSVDPAPTGPAASVGSTPVAWRDPRSVPWTSAVDVVIALAFFFLLCFGRPDAAFWLVEGAGPVLHALLVGACALALAVRRHSPLLFVVVAGICLSAHLVLFTGFSVFFVVTGLIAVETTQSRLEAPWRWVALVLEIVGVELATARVFHLIGGYVHAGEARSVVVVNIWLVTIVAAFVGAARRRSRDRYNRALERASVLEAQQATERRLAVIETQQRIARDVHDLLGHSLTVIAMQAEGARAILATDPAAADEALAVIGETSRRSVDEVHALVDMLRSDADADADAGDVDAAAVLGSGFAAGRGFDTGAAGRLTGGTGGGAAGTVEAGAEDGTGAGGATSGQRLELLREPVRQAQRAGLPVTLEADPTGRIPSAVAQVLHRVVQESLTNVLRHAPGAVTRVSLRTGAELVTLVVENAPVPESPAEDTDPALRTDDRSYRQNTGEQTDAVPAEAPHESATVLRPAVSVSEGTRHCGFGLIGMRDRVAQLGGTFTAGPVAEGGWRVTTELPCVPQ
ncbi:sensor histidine kinase [Actinomyces oris]|uniref:sensor histidine kinase n=1 Tax=Actinomyces oris TaxID=544580 RepID=UPI0009D760D4|nr:histidine kinase [Actinomyces oris]